MVTPHYTQTVFRRTSASRNEHCVTKHSTIPPRGHSFIVLGLQLVWLNGNGNGNLFRTWRLYVLEKIQKQRCNVMATHCLHTHSSTSLLRATLNYVLPGNKCLQSETLIPLLFTWNSNVISCDWQELIFVCAHKYAVWVAYVTGCFQHLHVAEVLVKTNNYSFHIGVELETEPIVYLVAISNNRIWLEIKSIHDLTEMLLWRQRDSETRLGLV